MSIKPRSITVAAANYPGGIRCYTKTPGGEVREASLEFSDYVLSKAMGNGTSDVLASGAGWKSSTSPFKCHPQSALCTVSWDEKGQSVFYQDEAGTLREQRSTESKGWKQTDLNQKNIKLGSKIAAVSSPKQAKVILFYQNVHDNICALTCENGRWKDSIALPCDAAYAYTGIGAAEWGDLNHVRVYFQHKDFSIQEGCKDASGTWTVTKSSAELKPIGDMAAIALETDVRLYTQDRDLNIITEFKKSGTSWNKTPFDNCRTMHNSDVIAFVRKVKTSPIACINIMWVGQDKFLKHSILHNGDRWLNRTKLAYLGFPGNCPGNWSDSDATVFSDYKLIATTIEDGQSRKTTVAAVHVQQSRGIRGIGVRYKGSKEEVILHGEKNKRQCDIFLLSASEDITTVWYRTDGFGLSGIQFGTSKARTSEWYGLEGGEFGCWNNNDHALIGFYGAQRDREGIAGLMPIWSQVKISTKYEEYKTRLAVVKDSVPKLQSELAKAAARASKLQAQWSAIEKQEKTATSALAELTESVEILCSFERQLADGQVKMTKRRDKFVTDQLKVCKDGAEATTASFNKLSKIAGTVPHDAKELCDTIDSLYKKGHQARVGLKSFIQAALLEVQGQKREVSKQLELRRQTTADAKVAAEKSTTQYRQARDIDTTNHAQARVSKGTQNPFDVPNVPTDETQENGALRDLLTQMRKDQAEFDYHAAHRDFLEHGVARLDLETKELEQAKAQLDDKLKTLGFKKVVDDVDALKSPCAIRAKEATNLSTLLKAFDNLFKQLPGRTDSKARDFATALVPIIEKVGAHTGLKMHSKVEVDTLLAVARKIVG